MVLNRFILKRFYLIGIVWALMVAAAVAQTENLTPEKLVGMKVARNVVIQPQGNQVAYILRVPRSADEPSGAAYNELWVVAANGGKARCYVAKPASVSAVKWTPDGQTITFLSVRSGVNKFNQVYGIPLNGGEAKQLSHAPRNISKYAFSPDGKSLAYTMTEEQPEAVKADIEKGFDQNVVDTWSVLTRLYVENLATQEVQLLSKKKLNVWEFQWTLDGKSLIYRAGERPFTDDRYMYTDNYIVAVNGSSERIVSDTEGKVGLAQLSRNGKYFAWLGAIDFSDPYAGSLFILPANGGKPKNLLKDFPGTAEQFVWKDTRTIVFVSLEKTRSYLYEISIPSGKFKKLTRAKGPVYYNISLAKDGKRYAASASTYNHPNEVFVAKHLKGTLKRLTYSNPEWRKMKFGKQETISWKGPDDWVIYGVLIKPVGYQKGKKYPLQVQVHGGPEGVRMDGWNTSYARPGQMLAQKGYMVLYPNYRGSIGRGVAFSKGDHQDLMGKEFEDILAGIDHLAEKGLIDPQQVGIGGGSYGGYTAAWAATKHSQRFRVSVVFVGISNQISKAGMTDTPAENAGVHWNFWLYDNFDLVWERSPLKHIKNAQTPTLILHGEVDRRVPLNQAVELYRGLKYVKVPTELVIYPREGHGNRERAHQLDLCRRTLEWYEKYLKGKAAQ